MKRFSAFCFSWVLFISAAAQADSLLIKNVNVLDVENRTIVSAQDIRIEDGKIVAITPHTEDRRARKSADREIDGHGMYATPGLIDMHVHVDLWRWGERADDWSLPLYIANGVTTVRDAAGSPITLALKAGVQRGALVGPRMIVATPFFTTVDVNPGSNVVTVKTPEDAKSKIDAYFSLGYDYVKTNLDIDAPVFTAMVDHLRAKGSYLMGHPLMEKTTEGYWRVKLDETLADYRTVEHLAWTVGDFLQSETSPDYRTTNRGRLLWYSMLNPDWSKLPALVEKFKTSPAMMGPNVHVLEVDSRFAQMKTELTALGLDGFRKHPLYRYLPDYYYTDWMWLFESWGTNEARDAQMRISVANQRRVIQALDQAGVPLIAGTDVPARPTMVAGFSLHRELEEMAKSGVAPWSVIRAATWNAAQALGKTSDLGVIQPGRFADLILSRENPIDRLGTLEQPEFVFAQGQVYDRAGLDALLEATHRNVRGLDSKKVERMKRNEEALSCTRSDIDHDHAHSHAKDPSFFERVRAKLTGWMAALI